MLKIPYFIIKILEDFLSCFFNEVTEGKRCLAKRDGGRVHKKEKALFFSESLYYWKDKIFIVKVNIEMSRVPCIPHRASSLNKSSNLVKHNISCRFII